MVAEADPRAHFTDEEIQRARRYHRPLYAATGVDAALGLFVLAVLAFGRAGDLLYGLVDGLAWWSAAPAFAALTLGCAWLVRLPLSYWRGYVHEKQWGFSTQSVRGWATDRVKGLVSAVVLTSLAMLGFVGGVRAFPGTWPVLVALGAAGLVLLLSFVGPVLLEPVFNRFEPPADHDLAEDLRALAVRARVPVRHVLVADASRRTRKENAYVSGLARTRRVVLFDTLLAKNDRRGVRVVTAHELGHRCLRHVARGTILGMAAAAMTVLAIWLLLERPSILGTTGAGGPGDPRVIPFVLLAAGALQLLALPFEAALSRRWEAAADRFSLELTEDLEAFEESFRILAGSNLLDLDPPRLVYLLLFTHPTPPERIAAARLVASGITSPSRPTTG